MQYHKVTILELEQRLADLIQSSKRFFGGNTDRLAVSMNMDVIPGYREREAVRLGIRPEEVNIHLVYSNGNSLPDNGLVVKAETV